MAARDALGPMFEHDAIGLRRVENRNLEETMKQMLRLTSAVIVTLAAASGPAMAQNFNDEPLNDKWAPTEWGADDKVGAPNRTTPETGDGVESRKARSQRSARFTRRMLPHSARDDRTCSSPSPALPQARRNWLQTSSTWRRNWGRSARNSTGRVTLASTRPRGYFYNGRFLHDKGIGAAGLGPLGVEHVAEVGFVCRGVLLDAVALRGGQLPVPKENSASDPGIVTAKDVDEKVKRQALPQSVRGTAFSSIRGTAIFGTQRTGIPMTRPRSPSASHNSMPVSLDLVSRHANISPSAR
jgi:hypothetical protein